jgi:hypothetical protein
MEPRTSPAILACARPILLFYAIFHFRVHLILCFWNRHAGQAGKDFGWHRNGFQKDGSSGGQPALGRHACSRRIKRSYSSLRVKLQRFCKRRWVRLDLSNSVSG